MPDFDVITIDCGCCQLRQRLRDRDGPAPTICDTCVPHQGSLPDKEIARARSHEAMVRERLAACRVREAHAREVAGQARERVASALASRCRLAARIVSAVAVVPPIVLALAKHPLVDRFDLSVLTCITSGATSLGGSAGEGERQAPGQRGRPAQRAHRDQPGADRAPRRGGQDPARLGRAAGAQYRGRGGRPGDWGDAAPRPGTASCASAARK
jgi:hypothetical protein